MTVVVTGIGLVSALGPTYPMLWQQLLQGRSAISLRQPFPALAPRPLAMLGKHPAQVDGLLQQATQAAIADAQLTTPAPQCGVVIGSSRGYQAQWEQFLTTGRIERWLDSLPHMGAIAVARQVGSHGPVLAPMAACATGLWAIAQGVQLIRSGQCQQAIVGAGEAAISPMTLTGFEQMRAMGQTGCYPFDERREGLVLGEGAAVLVLEAESLARRRGVRIYGRVLGVGLTADANHVTAPDTAQQQGGLTAIKTCLRTSQLRPEDVDLVHAHGTGTPLNDAYEATLIQTVLRPEVLVTGTKGAIGHTLGASGAIGAAICLGALDQQMVPPCTGLQQPAFNLNFVRQPLSAKLTTTLCFSFGFGGQNAVIAFGRA